MADEDNAPVVEQEAPRKKQPMPNRDRHVFLDGEQFDTKELGLDGPRERRITVNGVNYEHTDEHASGCWNYRRM